MKIKRVHLLALVLAVVACAVPFREKNMRAFAPAIQVMTGKKTVADRLEQYGEAARKRLSAGFDRIGVIYPPKRVVLAGLKHEKLLEVWVSGDGTEFRRLRVYPILAASGKLGSKLKQGDQQVPEGLYGIESLNPNSAFHLALRVNYPNDFDRAKGQADGRDDLGGDIMIHGGTASIGCLAMGDEAVEDLFVLAAETGLDNVSVILSPVDFRTRDLPSDMPPLPAWTPELHASIKQELAKLAETSGAPPVIRR